MHKIIRYFVYALFAFFVWLLAEPILDEFREQVQLYVPRGVVPLIIAGLLWFLLFWIDHNGPIPLSEIWWSRIFLWRVLDYSLLDHRSYVPLSANMISENLPAKATDNLVESLDFILQSGNKRLLLTGDPGSGKSFSVRVLSYEIAHRSFWSFRATPLIPIYIKDPSWIAQSWPETFGKVVDGLEKRGLITPLSSSELPGVLTDLLSKGKLLLLFDALDTSTEEQQKNLDHLLEQLTSKRRGASTKFVHVRRAFSEDLDVASYDTEIRIAPLNDSQLYQFLLQNNKGDVETVERLMSQLRDAGWLDSSSPGRNPLYLTFVAAGGDFNPNRAITLRNQIEKLITKLPPNTARKQRWSPVRFPEDAMKALAYLALEIQDHLIKGKIDSAALPLPEARLILRSYRENLRLEGREIASTPDDFLGTAAGIGLLGPQVEQYYLHHGLKFLTERDSSIRFEFRHDMLFDFFIGIGLKKIWPDLPNNDRSEVIKNPAWWDAVIYMISISDDHVQLFSEFEALRSELEPGILAGLAITSLLVKHKTEVDAEQNTFLQTYKAELQSTLARTSLSPEYRAILSLIARWVPLQFADLIVGLLDERSGLSESTRQEILSWLLATPLSMAVYIAVGAIPNSSIPFREAAQTAIMNSIRRFPVGVAESKLLIDLLTDPNTFTVAFPVGVILLVESKTFVDTLKKRPQTIVTKILIMLSDMAVSNEFLADENQEAVVSQPTNLFASKLNHWISKLELYINEAATANLSEFNLWNNSIEKRALATHLSVLDLKGGEIVDLLAECLKQDRVSRRMLILLLNESDLFDGRMQMLLRQALQVDRAYQQQLPTFHTWQELSLILLKTDSLEPYYESLSDRVLQLETEKFRRSIQRGNASIDGLLPNAFAVVREAAKRTLGFRLDNVHIMAGIFLHQDRIVECELGETSALAALLPAYLNGLHQQGVHVVVINDSLARRAARLVAPVFHALGFSVGVLQMAAVTENGKKAFLVDFERTSPQENQNYLRLVGRRFAYEADVTYGTSSEFGFDYLRDNMAMRLGDRVQRGHHYAIIDEVDHVLVDEALTPLIVSGPAPRDLAWYSRMAQVVRQLNSEDYEIAEKEHAVSITEVGLAHVEQLLNQPLIDPGHPEKMAPEQAQLRGYLDQALRAQFLYKRNKDYFVQAGKVVIVDESTGMLNPGRKWSDGLHQAVEAKEGVKIEPETKTYATITLQNYFRTYKKLSGITEGGDIGDNKHKVIGEEFKDVYGLSIVSIPSSLDYRALQPDLDLMIIENSDEEGYKFSYYARRDDPERRPIFWKRKDYPDVIYRTAEARLRAVVMEIIRHHVRGRPLLVGTTSAESSELLSNRLRMEPVRRLLQIHLIRHIWMEANNRYEDGRLIPQLQPFYESLEKISPFLLRRFMQPYGMTSMDPEDPSNIPLVLDILHLNESNMNRLMSILQGGIPHQILNARKHIELPQIIARAGALGAVTIATTKTIRGADIKLGGELADEIVSAVNRVLRKSRDMDPLSMGFEERRQALLKMNRAQYGIYEAEVRFFLQYFENLEYIKELGGLHVIGCERHEARRLDNQLRSRAARQGEPGSSRFYLSLEDNLMLQQGGSQVSHLMQRLRVDDTLPLQARLVGNVIEQSQHRIEGANSDVRKHLLKYDDVLNLQRSEIYSQRDRILLKEDLSDDIVEMLELEVKQRVTVGLYDDEGPWKLIAWLEQIQPPFMSGERLFPSFGLSLLLTELSGSSDLRRSVLSIISRAIEAENRYHWQVVENLIAKTREDLLARMAEHTDSLNTYLENLRDRENILRPQYVLEEIKSLLGMQLSLDHEQLRTLGEDPEEVKDDIFFLVSSNVTVMYASRVIAAIQNRLGESLGEKFEVSSWDDAADQILKAAQKALERRRERLVGTNGEIPQDINDLMPRELNDAARLQLLLSLSQGTRTVFDQKTHRQVKQVFTRFSYAFLVAQLLEGREVDQVVEDILLHLEEADEALRFAWGQREYARLAANAQRLSDFGPAAKMVFGEERVNEMVANLGESDREALVESMGRYVLNEVHRQVLLNATTELWVDYLTRMEALRVSIGLEAYAQHDPLVQYKGKASEMFAQLMEDIRELVISRIFTYQPKSLEITAPETTISALAATQTTEIKSSQKKKRQP